MYFEKVEGCPHIVIQWESRGRKEGKWKEEGPVGEEGRRNNSTLRVMMSRDTFTPAELLILPGDPSKLAKFCIINEMFLNKVV